MYKKPRRLLNRTISYALAMALFASLLTGCKRTIQPEDAETKNITTFAQGVGKLTDREFFSRAAAWVTVTKDYIQHPTKWVGYIDNVVLLWSSLKSPAEDDSGNAMVNSEMSAAQLNDLALKFYGHARGLRLPLEQHPVATKCKGASIKIDAKKMTLLGSIIPGESSSEEIIPLESLRAIDLGGTELPLGLTFPGTDRPVRIDVKDLAELFCQFTPAVMLSELLPSYRQLWDDLRQIIDVRKKMGGASILVKSLENLALAVSSQFIFEGSNPRDVMIAYLYRLKSAQVNNSKTEGIFMGTKMFLPGSAEGGDNEKVDYVNAIFSAQITSCLRTKEAASNARLQDPRVKFDLKLYTKDLDSCRKDTTQKIQELGPNISAIVESCAQISRDDAAIPVFGTSSPTSETSLEQNLNYEYLPILLEEITKFIKHSLEAKEGLNPIAKQRIIDRCVTGINSPLTKELHDALVPNKVQIY
jgi:hypothetical protein